MGMNGLDWAAAVILLAGTVIGFYRGLVSQLVSVAGLIVAYMVAFAFYKEAAPWIAQALSLPSYASYQKYEYLVKGLHLDTYMYNAIAFALLLFGVKLALSIVGRILNWIALTPGIKLINQWSGAALGAAEALVLIIVAVQVMTVLPNDSVQQLLKSSQAAPYLMNAVPAVSDKLHELWDQSKSV